uniref:MORC family CW-type zinc finger 1 n=1 Tax=Propithecus coquereli TaxID=379532 RepID=A0A2K6G262_PROCO
MGDRYGALRRAQLHLDFIHANSTTHSFLFGALAELLDNARDSGAARLDVFSVDNEKLQGGFMLCFLDDGCGMSPEEASDIIYFGTSKKRLSTLKFIGQYGNGLKSGSMRIGKDFVLFTKKEETMTCMFFSQTFCEREGLNEVFLPFPQQRYFLTFIFELSNFFLYSSFTKTFSAFKILTGQTSVFLPGTLLVIYNLKLLLSGEPELDVKTDKEDILMTGAFEDFPERWSFRAYASVLYFDPWMRIFIQAKKVKTKHLCYCLYRPSIKHKKDKINSSFEEIISACLSLIQWYYVLSQPNVLLQDVLQEALEDVEAKHKNLKEKRRRTNRTLSSYFNNRFQEVYYISCNSTGIHLIFYSIAKFYKIYICIYSLRLGAGVVGIVNIPLEIMEPSHNKQEFLNVQEYNHLLKVMGQCLVQYCKDTGISNRNLTWFWNEFGYQNNKDMDKPLDSIQYQRRQAMAIPFIIQCDLCLKWRVLPSSTNYQEKEFVDLWICANNPNLLENSCHQVEKLPSIPLGTINTVSSSKNEKEKQLRESVQRYQNRLAEQQPPENTKTQKIRLLGDDSKHETLSSFELLVSRRGQKRDTEKTDSDVEYVSETKIRKKYMRKKMKPQQQRHPAALTENVKLAERPQLSVWRAQTTEGPLRNTQASPWEMKRKQSVNPVQKCKALIEVETISSDPDIILVLNKSNTDTSLKQEKKEIPLINKEKQELRIDAPAIKRNSSLPNWKSVPMEDVKLSSGHKDRVFVSDSCKVASSLTSFQSTSVKETVRKLISNL